MGKVLVEASQPGEVLFLEWSMDPHLGEWCLAECLVPTGVGGLRQQKSRRDQQPRSEESRLRVCPTASGALTGMCDQASMTRKAGAMRHAGT